jgi:hypothetical protein
MIEFSKYLQRGPALLVLAAALSACGGGGGGGASTPAPTPTPTPTPTPVGPAPTAVADTVVAGFNKSTTLTPLANDTVTAGGTLALVSATAPAHGTATVSGNNVVYAPTAGFIGKDTFSYTVNAGAGSSASTATVSVTVSADMTLSGKVIDVPANSTVTVAVGARTSTVTADATGSFSAPVVLDAPESMITVTAQGSGAQSHVKLVSLLGDSQLAVSSAGAATTLTPAMLAGLKVSNLSTALYAQATRKNGGVVPATQQALDAAAANVGVSEMLQMAAVIRSVIGSANVAPRRTLPAGAADVVALVTNTPLYTQYVKQIAPSALFSEISAMYDDAANLTSAPAIAVGSTQSLNFYGAEACCAIAATEIVLNPDGSGSISKDKTRVAGTWTRDATSLTLTLATPVVRSEFTDAGTTPPSQIEVQTITRQFIIRQVTGSAGHGFAMIAQAGTIRYPGGQRADGSFSSNTMSAFSEWSRLSAPADVSGSSIAGVPDLINTQAVGQRQLVMALAAGGAASSPQLPLVAANWKMEGNKLVIDMGAGKVQTMARVAVAANAEERWLSRVASGSDYSVVEFAGVRVQPGLSFTQASAVNRWRARPPQSEIGVNLYLNLLSNLTATDEAEELNGTVTTIRDNSWSVENGAVVVTSFRLPDGSAAGSCPAGVTCTVRTQRTWVLLRSDASGVFVFETSRLSESDVRYRVIRYDRAL